MRLSMAVLRSPDKVPPEARTVSGGEFYVGRGPDVDWILPDPDRLLSKRHFAVAFRGGIWHVADTSTNGTFLNTDPDAIGKGVTRALRDGDRLRLGAYEIEVRLAEQPAMGGGFGQGSMGQGSMGQGGIGANPMAGHGASSPFDDPLGDHPFAPPSAPRTAFGETPYEPPAVTRGSALLPEDFAPLVPAHSNPAHRGGIPDDFHTSSPSAQQPLQGFGVPSPGGYAGGALLPDDFDPLAPDHPSGSFRGPVQSDHSSPLQDALLSPPHLSPPRPPAPTPPPHTPMGVSSTGGPLLDDDWDKALDNLAPPGAASAPPPLAMPPLAETAIPASPTARAPVPDAAPVTPAMRPPDIAAKEPTGVPPGPAFEDGLETIPPRTRMVAPATSAPASSPDVAAVPFPEPASPGTAMPPVVRQRPARPPLPAEPSPLVDPFAEDAGQTPFAATATAAPLLNPVLTGHGPAAEPSPFDEDVPSFTPAFTPAAAPVVSLATARPSPPMTTPPAASMTTPPAAIGGADPLAAFLAGAGLPSAHPADPMAMMKGLGEAFRAMVAGLRAVLIARATIKSEFRIEQTMIRARGNNPLKFAANDEDALTALLGVGRRTDMSAAAAVEDSLRDLRLHEVATMAAMQVAVRAMMEEISPDKIRAGTGGMTLLAAQKKARAWDVFETRHAATMQAMSDDFDSVFGKSFARAYERALAEMALRES